MQACVCPARVDTVTRGPASLGGAGWKRMQTGFQRDHHLVWSPGDDQMDVLPLVNGVTRKYTGPQGTNLRFAEHGPEDSPSLPRQFQLGRDPLGGFRAHGSVRLGRGD